MLPGSIVALYDDGEREEAVAVPLYPPALHYGSSQSVCRSLRQQLRVMCVYFIASVAVSLSTAAAARCVCMPHRFCRCLRQRLRVVCVLHRICRRVAVHGSSCALCV